MKRLAIVLVLALPFSLVGQNAYADKPTITRTPVDDEFPDESCGFAVDVVVQGVEVAISYTDEEGVYHEFDAFPQGTQTLTNVETQESITFNISGPGKVTISPDGSFTLVGTGTWSWPFNPDTGESGWFLTEGRFVLTIDAEGNLTISRIGHILALCPLIAA